MVLPIRAKGDRPDIRARECESFFIRRRPIYRGSLVLLPIVAVTAALACFSFSASFLACSRSAIRLSTVTSAFPATFFWPACTAASTRGSANNRDPLLLGGLCAVPGADSGLSAVLVLEVLMDEAMLLEGQSAPAETSESLFANIKGASKGWLV